MNKRSQYFGLFIAVSAVIALGTAFFVLGVPAPIKGQLGVKQLNIVSDYQQAESILFFIDQSAGLSSDLAIKDLAFNGGFKIPKCGKIEDFHVWRKDCFPDFNEEFKIFFSQRLDSFIEAYSKGLPGSVSVPLNNYDLSLIQRDKLQIIAVAKSPLFVARKNDSGVVFSNYSVYPHFSAVLDYDFKEFNDIVVFSKDLLVKCKDDTFNCVLKETAAKDEEWKVGGESTTSKVFFFDIPSTKKVPVVRGGAVVYDPVRYRFALDFS